jgi:hypothetical protein
VFRTQDINSREKEVEGYDPQHNETVVPKIDRAGDDTFQRKGVSPLLWSVLHRGGGKEGALRLLAQLREQKVENYAITILEERDYASGVLDQDKVYEQFLKQVGGYASNIAGLKDAFLSQLQGARPDESRNVSALYGASYEFSAATAYEYAEQTSTKVPGARSFQITASLFEQGRLGNAPANFVPEQGAQFVLDTALAAYGGVSAYRGAVSLLKPQPEGAWLLGDKARGLNFEERLGGNLPPNFKTYDRLEPDVWYDPQAGRATSIKSMNLFDRYRDPADLLSTGKGYVNKVIDFEEYTRAGVRLDSEMVKSRRLDIVIPKGVATPDQIDALRQIRAYGLDNDVMVRIIEAAR